MTYRLRDLLLATAGCAVLALAASFLLSVDHLIRFGINDAYAKQGAADMVVAYMVSHEDRWPACWGDLEPIYASRSGVSGWDYSEFQERVWIDFEADVSDLRDSANATDEPEFEVIGARYSDAYWEPGPNHRIWSYLRKKSQTESQSAPTPAASAPSASPR